MAPVGEKMSRCALCDCPVVDGGMQIFALDSDRVSEWWQDVRGEALNEEILNASSMLCVFCLWRARYNDVEILGKEPLPLPLWIDENYSHFADGLINQCWVTLKKVPEAAPENLRSNDSKFIEKKEETHLKKGDSLNTSLVTTNYEDEQSGGPDIVEPEIKLSPSKKKVRRLKLNSRESQTEKIDTNSVSLQQENNTNSSAGQVQKKGKHRHYKDPCFWQHDTYKCPKCDKGFTQQAKLLRHTWRCLVEATECQCCGFPAETHQKLRQHLDEDKECSLRHRGATLPWGLSCDKCSKFYGRDSKRLKNHWTLMHKEKGVAMTCPLCAKVFYNRFLYQRHRRFHPSPKSKQGRCRHWMSELTDSVLRTATKRMKNKKKPKQQYNTQMRNFVKKWRLHTLLRHPHSLAAVVHVPAICPRKSKENGRIGFKERMLRCKFCKEKFSTGVALELHQMFVHRDKRRCCQGCGQFFLDRGLLQEHLMLDGECSKLHVKNVNSTIKHRCQLCRKGFQEKKGLQIHVEQLHKAVYHRISCSHCGKHFFQEVLLKEHIQRLHSPAEAEDPPEPAKSPITKTICDSSSQEEPEPSDNEGGSLEIGQEVSLLSPSELLCNLCGLQLESQQELEKHTSEQHFALEVDTSPLNKSTDDKPITSNTDDKPIPSKKFSCKKCNTGYNSVKDLEIHIEATHAFPKCSKCGSQFGNQEYLNAHKLRGCAKPLKKKVTNPPNNTFSMITSICQGCNASFKSAQLLDEHLAKDSECAGYAIKCRADCPWRCISCGLGFSNPGELRVHITGLHQNPKKVCCSTCGKVFYNGGLLLRHEKKMMHGGSAEVNESESAKPNDTKSSPDDLMVIEVVRQVPSTEAPNKNQTVKNFVVVQLNKDSAGKTEADDPMIYKLLCERCGIKCETKNQLVQHKVACSGRMSVLSTVESNWYQCSGCLVWFTKKALCRHMLAPYCARCNTKFTCQLLHSKHESLCPANHCCPTPQDHNYLAKPVPIEVIDID